MRKSESKMKIPFKKDGDLDVLNIEIELEHLLTIEYLTGKSKDDFYGGKDENNLIVITTKEDEVGQKHVFFIRYIYEWKDFMDYLGHIIWSSNLNWDIFKNAGQLLHVEEFEKFLEEEYTDITRITTFDLDTRKFSGNYKSNWKASQKIDKKE